MAVASGPVRLDVIFGASGDLTQRKVMPASTLAFRHLLLESFGVVGVSRTMTADSWERMRQAVIEHARDEFRTDVWERLADGLHYVAANFGIEDGEEELVAALTDLDETHVTAGNRVYYLAVPPEAFDDIVTAMGRRCAAGGWTRLVVEKPFGYDLTARRS